MSRRSGSRSMKQTSLSRRLSVRHRSFTNPSENTPLPAPMMLILTDFGMPFLVDLLVMSCGLIPPPLRGYLANSSFLVLGRSPRSGRSAAVGKVTPARLRHDHHQE